MTVHTFALVLYYSEGEYVCSVWQNSALVKALILPCMMHEGTGCLWNGAYCQRLKSINFFLSKTFVLNYSRNH